MNDIGIIWLTKGAFAIVDIEDYERLSKFKWQSSLRGYASRSEWRSGKPNKMYLMHRVINKTPDGLHTDHINGHIIDNRKQNLRNATNGQNRANSVKSTNSKTSRFKGVCWDKQKRKWHAQITKNNKVYHLGRFHVEEKAAQAYDKAALEMHGEFALINAISPTLPMKVSHE